MLKAVWRDTAENYIGKSLDPPDSDEGARFHVFLLYLPTPIKFFKLKSQSPTKSPHMLINIYEEAKKGYTTMCPSGRLNVIRRLWSNVSSFPM